MMDRVRERESEREREQIVAVCQFQEESVQNRTEELRVDVSVLQLQEDTCSTRHRTLC